MTDNEDERIEKFRQAAANFSAALKGAGHLLTVQGAMGWMMRGDIEKARAQLARIPREQLLTVSIAAAALSGLADEMAAETGEPDL